MTVLTDDLSATTNFALAHGTALISSGGLFTTSSEGSYDGSYHNSTALTADHYTQVVIAGKAASTYFDCKGRHNGSTDASRNGWQSSVGGSNERYITEVTGGAGTDRVANTVTFNNGDILEYQGEGTTHRHVLNGTAGATYTSSLYQSQNRVGLGMYRIGTGTFNDFEAGDIGGAGPTIYTRKPFDSPIFKSRVIQ